MSLPKDPQKLKEWRRKQSRSHTGKKRSKESRQNIRKAVLNYYKQHKVSEKTKKKLSLALKGRVAWNKGKKLGRNPKHSKFMKKFAKKMWERPGFRKSRVTAMKKLVKNRGYQKKVSMGLKKSWKNPKVRRRHIIATHKARERISASAKKAAIELWNDPKFRKRVLPIIRKTSKQRWKNLRYKKSVSAAIRKGLRTPESHKIMSMAQKKHWRNPNFRERVLTAVKKAWSNPKLRERQAQTSKKIWSSTKLRKRVALKSLKRWKNPTYKRKVSKLISKGLQKPDVIALLRKLRYNQVFPQKDTLPERMLQQELRKRKIEFKKHVNFSFCQPDLVFEKKKVAVFADGEHWHNYPEGKKRDKLQNKLLRKMGWKVLRFWDYHQIRPNVHKCVDKIERELKG